MRVRRLHAERQEDSLNAARGIGFAMFCGVALYLAIAVAALATVLT